MEASETDGNNKPRHSSEKRKGHHDLNTMVKDAVAKVAGDHKTTIVQQAIAKVAGKRRATQAVEETGAKSSIPKIQGREAAAASLESPGEKYQKSPTADAKTTKEVKDSIDAVVGKEAPNQAGRPILEEVATTPATPPPQNLEAQATDVGAIYARQGGGAPKGDDAASFYRDAAGGGDEYRGKNPADQFDESGNPLNAYANKEIYHSRSEGATGQRLASHGDEELSLSGRIQKMYHGH